MDFDDPMKYFEEDSNDFSEKNAYENQDELLDDDNQEYFRNINCTKNSMCCPMMSICPIMYAPYSTYTKDDEDNCYRKHHNHNYKHNHNNYYDYHNGYHNDYNYYHTPLVNPLFWFYMLNWNNRPWWYR